MIPRIHAFWAINAALDQARLRQQLEQFRAAGFDGVVWHPRFYPNEPPYPGERYLAELSDVILHAKSLGLTFWIYDENGWPSGTVGGQLLKKHPQDAQRWADLISEKPERCLAEFERDGKKWFLAERAGAGVDYFSPDLARHFIQMTHERYRDGLKPEAWRHVEAIFSDEPEFGLGHAFDSLSKHGAIPWTPKLPEIFRHRYGEELLPLIPQILFPGNDAAEVRVKFWELLTDIFNESFTAPINDWCARHGKLFTAHVKGEEHPLFQVPTSGSCHQFFRNLSLPAIDALERYPSNNYFPRQVSSAARQFGNGRCMVEAFGGAGWGATPEDLENYLLWLGRHGLTDFVMHLSQYRLDSPAIRDWPPSQPLHLTWRAVYPEVLRRVRRELENHPRPAAGTLVITPNRGIMAGYDPQEFLKTNIHNAATYPDTVAGRINRSFLERVEELHRAGVDYDIADERTVEQFGKLSGGQLVLGNCKYVRVILGTGCELMASARNMVGPLVTSSERTVAKPGIKTVALAVNEMIPVQWRLEQQPVNCLLLECAADDEDYFTTEFECLDPLSPDAFEIVFADDIAAVELNGVRLGLTSSDEGSRTVLPPSVLRSENKLRFRPTKNAGLPFVWLRGIFRVASDALFTAGPRGTVKTTGRFSLHAPRETIQPDLIADGFPFLREPFLVAATVNFTSDVSLLRLEGVSADAVRLEVNGRNCGWAWRNNGEIQFGVKLPAGSHQLRLKLLPNSFNSFGPHHYYGGDWFVVSPDQFRGVRNFADPDGAPENTHVKAWHFRRFELPQSISVF